MNDIDTKPEKLAWFAAVVAVALLTATIVLARVSECTTLAASCVSSAVLLLSSLVAAGRLRFTRKEFDERLSVEQYREEHGSAELFGDSDEAVKVAARANRGYVRYFVPVFTVVLGVAIIVTGVVLWRQWSEALVFPVSKRALRHTAFAVTLLLVCVVSGSYYVGISREEGCRWLRPLGAWLFFTGLSLLLGMAVLVCEHFDVAVETLDLRVARVAMALVIALGVELIVNFVIEFYRPRGPHEEERPLHESRLLALFTEPGGVARNVAASLDYQFGFEVSEAWFYRFLERTLIPFVIVMAVAFWLLSTIAVINPEENGIRELFGSVSEENRQALGPGLHLKLPWPLARIYRFPVERVQMVAIGHKDGHDEGHGEGDGHGHEEEDVDPEEEGMQGDPTGRVILWSKLHGKEEINFVVASAPSASADPQDPRGEGTREERAATAPPAAYFVTANIPLYFKVTDLYSYAYKHRDPSDPKETRAGPRKTLAAIAAREVVHYLANVDLLEIMTSGQEEGGEFLKRRIQAAADERELGVEVVFLGLQGLHPPVRVGEAFDQVMAAMEEQHEKVLEAEAWRTRTVNQAKADAYSKIMAARSYREDQTNVPEARAKRFNEQLAGYKAEPDVYMLRTFLDVLQTEAADTRKYIMAHENGKDVIVLDLKQKQQLDLLDIELDRTDGTEEQGEER